MAGNVSWYEDYLDSETPDCSLCHNLTIKHCHHTGQGYQYTEKGQERYKWSGIDFVAQWEISSYECKFLKGNTERCGSQGAMGTSQ